ncbi:uncharacterized protein LOC120636773 [Pararge aegeria]|uniref:Jg23328 protein n=1 Tax=Pararge aegeria aegeria TaxID=348720 RepID=A0A8S4QP94_9NEOP|nr:uncharacterized protein LOC120636773 [Pararge aegeria]CAH2211432.1 jg23328 [Pararge aegeria aegeria]
MATMDVLRKTVEDLATSFNTRMDEFQREVRTSIPAASPSFNINAQFGVFRSFVMTALENLQLQLQLLSRQQDDLDVRTRRKMLLVHGVPEASSENPGLNCVRLLSERLALPDISVSVIKQCHRLGRPAGDKPRPILIKFQDQDLRNKVWFSKTKLKGSGFTLSEFLTKGRHDAFIAARKRFGMTQCWTRDGCVVVLGPDGARHRVTSVAEVIAIPDSRSGTVNSATSSATSSATTSAATIALVTPKSNVTVRARKPIRK